MYIFRSKEKARIYIMSAVSYKKEKKQSTGPAVNATKYHGSVQPNMLKLGDSITTKYFETATVATTSVAGLMSPYNFDASLSNAPDLSAIQTEWQEWRCLKMEVEFLPSFENSYPTSTATGGVITLFLDRQNQTVTAALVNALNYEAHKVTSINKRCVIAFEMDGTNEAQWLNTNLPTTTVATIRSSSSTMSISTTYGIFIARYLFQLRSKI